MNGIGLLVFKNISKYYNYILYQVLFANSNVQDGFMAIRKSFNSTYFGRKKKKSRIINFFHNEKLDFANAAFKSEESDIKIFPKSRKTRLT